MRRFKGVFIGAMPAVLGGAYSWGVFRLWDLFRGTPIYLAAPLACVFSLPITLFCMLLLKKGNKMGRILVALYMMPVLIFAAVCGVGYLWSACFGGNLFLCLGMVITGGGVGATALCLGAISLVTVGIYLKLTGGKNEDIGNNSK